VKNNKFLRKGVKSKKSALSVCAQAICLPRPWENWKITAVQLRRLEMRY